MTALTLVVLTVFLGCLGLLAHPLLRHLKMSEVPAALLAACTGRLTRRRLVFILRSRREVYLEDIACLPPEYLLVALAWNRMVALVRRRLAFAWKHGPLVTPPREKTLAAGSYPVPSAAHVARALKVHPGSVSVRGIGPRQAAVTVSRRVRSFDDILADDWRDDLPAACNPWAGPVDAELAERRMSTGAAYHPDPVQSEIHDGHGRFL